MSSDSENDLCEARPRVLFLLARRFRSTELAEDAVQSAFLECLARVRREEAGIENPGGLLYTIAKRRLLDALRRRERESAPIERAPDCDGTRGDEALIDKERVRIVVSLLGRLSEDEQEVLRLRFFEELSPREVAERLQLGAPQVSRLQWRALNRLRKLLSERSISP